MTLEHILTEFDYNINQSRHIYTSRENLLIYDGHCAIFNYNTSDYFMYIVDAFCLNSSLFLLQDYCYAINSGIYLNVLNLLHKKERAGFSSMFRLIKFESHPDSIRLAFAVRGNFDKDIADDLSFMTYEKMENFFLHMYKLKFNSSVCLEDAFENTMHIIEQLGFLEPFASSDSHLRSAYKNITGDAVI